MSEAHKSALILDVLGEEAMEAQGRALARCLQAGAAIFLFGNLGAGKTTLTRGLLRGAGWDGRVRSPTYTLVEPYSLAGLKLHHFDLYRLGDPEELEYMGIREYFDGTSVNLVEWPERGLGMLPRPDLSIRIEYLGEGRRLHFQPRSPLGESILSCLHTLKA